MASIPSYYSPNSRFSLKLAQGELWVTVVQAFTPFNMSQALLVRVVEQTPTLHLLPGSLVIAKFYDPRCMAQRKGHKYRPAMPWTYETELESAQRRRPPPNSSIYHWDLTDTPEDDDDVVGWEEVFYQKSHRLFRAEVEAYRLLEPLQGSGIPQFFASGTLNLPPSEPRAIPINVVLLEHIRDSISVGELSESPSPPHIPKELLESLFETVSRFAGLGVAHTDLNLGNVLFTPAEHYTRACVIDFGNAIVREPDRTEEGWGRVVDWYDDLMGLKLVLERAFKDLSELVDLTKYIPAQRLK
ncbi:hypothetical protein JAAARDRAFT_200091 [Jaapia argillacea MUCL 33604]|uniref:Protein kinase domain-containing protein n=1 Tax=Jaapia argillacea MUCL 33604 TaxID=933084 RepID=A0A067PIM5_9AGAM|nr:hypothetical protein JAAARDRAFT_200091 [Jaapia argillacea MUCL 33604]